ncbi:pentapeptide repeat-containing protein [Saccharothrix luteola]|uniref:pentapeptide repeat-containing protein n=1 Tax=Saccharothrix luteola TaxID=2893018 RepID=UPI001E565000|nr:pentapeptide repeat-containing protein [Saccharothrix luteola]MCC8251064.1 pentapeptide repeat-containing protein [Saccharothrix luteola]
MALLALAVAAGPPLLALLAHFIVGLSAFMWANTGWGRDMVPLMVVASVAGVLLWLAARRFRERTASGGQRSAWASMSVSERTSLITSVTAVVALAVTALSVQATREQVELAARGQVNDRYDKAVGQLASDKPEVRVGGILALERVAMDSPGEAGIAAGLLAAFIRSAAQRQARPCDSADDVRVAVSTLTRLAVYDSTSALDLRNTCLSGTSWLRAQLVGADFSGADLEGAQFVQAELGNSRFVGANLGNAVFVGTSLAHADLSGASLRGVDLTDANLRGAKLSGADVGQAKLPPDAPTP